MSLKITVSKTTALKLSADVVAVGIEQGASPRKGFLRDLAKQVGKSVGRALRLADFSGKPGQLCEIHTAGRLKAELVLLIGLGEGALTSADVRRFAAVAARRAQKARAASLGVALPNVEGAVRACAEGAVLGAYRFEKFRTEATRAKHALERVTLMSEQRAGAAERAQAELGLRVGAAVTRARDLINTPPNELYPATLAKYAADVAAAHKADGVSAKVFDHAQIKKMGMRLLDAVGRGSRMGPHFVHMKYRPLGSGRKQLKRLVFVGKGVTFDTGGICIKPGPGMDDMKGDMGGAANVIALMAAVAVTQPQAEIHVLVACAENMPDGLAYRPGDVFESYHGKTVEIINTDAEGRLILADALHYGAELKPDFMLDNATLTGAAVVALGQTVSAYYTGSEALAATFKAAAKRAGEAMWEMPLVEDLREKLKSEWADVKHMGDRWGGSITAALFLREFVGEVPWIHVDVAGPSMAEKSYDIYSKGGTGAGVLTYLELIDGLLADGTGATEDTEAAE